LDGRRGCLERSAGGIIEVKDDSTLPNGTAWKAKKLPSDFHQIEDLPPDAGPAAKTAAMPADKEKTEPDLLNTFRPGSRVDVLPSSAELVLLRYKAAIRLQDYYSNPQFKGFGLLMGISLCTIYYIIYIGMGESSIVPMTILLLTHLPGAWILFLEMIALIALTIFFAQAIPYLLLMDLCAPDSCPIILDRKNQQVYRLYIPPATEEPRNPKRRLTLKPLYLHAFAYHWSWITAEHRMATVSNTNSVSRYHELRFVVRDPAKGDDGPILDSFQVGNGFVLNETMTPRFWEYLRRYMENNGPSLPEGESFSTVLGPKPSFWKIMGVISPYSPAFFDWWRDSKIVTTIFLIGLPILLIPFTAWAILNWICTKTTRRTIWPQELLQRIGEPFPRQ
jgi:hypothetical protein